MRIIYLHQFFKTPEESGSARSYEMARRLVAWGHEVDMVTSQIDISKRKSKKWDKYNVNGIRVHRIIVPYSSSMSYARRIKAFIQFAVGASIKIASFEADVVFATSTPLTIAIPGIFAAKYLRIPFVFEIRDLWPEIPIAMGAIKGVFPVYAAKLLEHFAYRNSSQIVALSPGMKNGVISTGYPEERVHVIPNSSDPEFFYVQKERGIEFRNRYLWLKDRPLIIYTGTIGNINGVDYMVRLAAAMIEIDPKICFLVVGEGIKKREVKALAEQMKVLNNNFYMLNGHPKKEIPEILSAADVLLSLVIDLPELWNNSANKYFDAFAAGKPVAINYMGWQAEVLEKSGAGIVLPQNNIKGAAEMLYLLLKDKNRLKEAGEASKKLGQTDYNRNILAKKLEYVLKTAIRNK